MSEPTRPLSAIPFDLEIEPERYELREGLPYRFAIERRGFLQLLGGIVVLVAARDAYTQESGLPVIGCCCPACGDLSLKRQRIKRLIAELEIEHPDIKQSMIRAIGHVVPSHLLDTRLHPVPQVAAAMTGSNAV